MATPPPEPVKEGSPVIQLQDFDPELLKDLRRSWKWAAICDFLWTFSAMIRMEFLDYADLERDLITGSTTVLSQVIIRLLGTLTQIRGLGSETWVPYLRRHLARRDDNYAVLGTDEKPLEFWDITYQQRLDLLHNLCEWQFQNPIRLRQTMTHEQDETVWRSEPVGRDSRRNLYWQFGRDRLWIQRPTKKEDPKSKQKGKKKGDKSSSRKSSGKKASKKAPPKPKPVKEKAPQPPRPQGTRISSRLHKAGGEGEWQELPTDWVKAGSASGNENSVKDASAKQDTVDPEKLFDDASDLTELSDSEDGQPKKAQSTKSKSPFGGSDLSEPEDEPDTKPTVIIAREPTPDPSHPDFVELETICVTMDDWRNFAAKWANAKHPDEKKLLKYAKKQMIPFLEEHQEAFEEAERAIQAAKERREAAEAAEIAALAAKLEPPPPKPVRATRLALRSRDVYDSEDARKQSEALQELELRRRRGEKDAKIDDSGRTKRASARNALRRKEDERAAEEELAAVLEEEGIAESSKDGSGGKDEDEYRDEEIPRRVEVTNGGGRPRRAAGADAEAAPARSRHTRKRYAESDDDDENDPWFLNCDVCHKSGWNKDQNQKLVACSECNFWQHVACHERQDAKDGKPKRDWQEDPLICKACTIKAASKRTRKRRKKDPSDVAENDATPSLASVNTPVVHPSQVHAPNHNHVRLQAQQPYHPQQGLPHVHSHNGLQRQQSLQFSPNPMSQVAHQQTPNMIHRHGVPSPHPHAQQQFGGVPKNYDVMYGRPSLANGHPLQSPVPGMYNAPTPQQQNFLQHSPYPSQPPTPQPMFSPQRMQYQPPPTIQIPGGNPSHTPSRANWGHMGQSPMNGMNGMQQQMIPQQAQPQPASYNFGGQDMNLSFDPMLGGQSMSHNMLQHGQPQQQAFSFPNSQMQFGNGLNFGQQQPQPPVPYYNRGQQGP